MLVLLVRQDHRLLQPCRNCQSMMPPAAAPEQAAAPTPATPAMVAMPQVAGMTGSGMGIMLGQKPNLSGAGGPENDYMGTTPYNNGVAAPGASTPRPPMRPQDMGPTMPSNFAVRVIVRTCQHSGGKMQPSLMRISLLVAT